MWILLPVISIFLTYNLLGKRNKYCNNNLRLTLVITFLLHAVGIFIVTEILSVFNIIQPNSIKTVWCLDVLILFFITRQKKLPFSSPIKEKIKVFFTTQPLIFASIVFILSVSLTIALVAYPNTWDSMTYHLSRVMYWIQNGNVNHFPTNNDRQLGLAPFAEYCLLHIKCLSTYDPFLNVLQWMAMFCSVLVVSLITKEAGGNNKTQLLSAFIAICIPMGILQSNSTQNDYVESFFIVASLLFLIKNIKYKFLLGDDVLFILCCCLAITTKGTALIFLIPIVCIWLFYMIYNLRWKFIKVIAIGVFLFSVFCLPHAIRNIQTFNQPLGGNYALTNADFGIFPTLSNMFKNVSIHLKTPYPQINSGIESCVKNLSNLIGIDVYSENYNWNPSSPFHIGLFSTHEDAAGNALHVLSLFVCFIIYLFRKNLRKNKLINIVLIAGILMFILFCALLKWQVWNSRLQLPIFVCLTPFLAFILSEIKSRNTFSMLILILLNFSAIFLFANQSRPLFGKSSIFTTSKTNQYFINNEILQKPFVEISALLKEDSITRVALISSLDGWQYPFWALQKQPFSIQINQIHVENDSKYLEEKLPFNAFSPQAIICTNCDADSSMLWYHNIPYKQKYRFENWRLYEEEILPE